MIARRRTPVLAAAVALAVLAGCGAPADLPFLPDVVGITLDRAKQTVQDAGWNDVTSHDVLESRTQIVDGNWQVCDQAPVAGPAEADAEVDLGVVRTEETCPGQPPPTTTSPPTTARPVPTTTPAVPTAVPVPQVSRQPEPERDDSDPSDDTAGSDAADESDSRGSDVATVNPGSYCGTPGAVGVTSSGTPMVCAPGSDGRDRWRSS